MATIAEEVGLMKELYSTKTRAQQEKYFWQNSSKYLQSWVKRSYHQPTPLAQGKPAPAAPARGGGEAGAAQGDPGVARAVPVGHGERGGGRSQG